MTELRRQRKVAGDPAFDPGEWVKFDPSEWAKVEGGPHYPPSPVGADPLGRRFSPLADVSPEEAAAQADAEVETRKAEEKKVRDDNASRLLGAEFDPTQEFQPGALGYLRLVDVFRSQDLVNRQNKFRETFPEGELKQITHPDGELGLYARSAKDEPFRAVSSSPAIVSALATGSTVGSFLGARGSTAAGTIGTMVGVVADAAIENARGYPEDTSQSVAARSLKEGAIFAGVDLGLKGFGAVVLHRSFSTSDAVKAAQAEGFHPLMIGQVSDDPLVGVALKQVTRLGLAGTKHVIDAERKSILEAAKRQVAAGADLTDTMIADVVDAQRMELDTLLSPTHITRKGTSQALQDGLVFYKKASERYITHLYNKAITLADDLVLDLTPAVDKAVALEKGVQAHLKEAAESGAATASVAPKLAGELNDVVQTLKTLDPTMRKVTTVEGEWTAFEQIKALRTRLFDLKNEAPEGYVRKTAGEMYQTLTSVMNAPISGSPEFGAAWRKASGAHALKESNLEKTYVGSIVSGASDNPEALQSLAGRYFEPGHATELATFRDLIPRPVWQKVREGFQADLMTTPDISAGYNKLRQFKARDPEGFGLLLTPAEARDVEHYLNLRSKIESGPFAAVQKKNLSAGERVAYLLNNGTQQDLADLVKLSGGIDSEPTRAIRAGVYSRILSDASVTLKTGERVIDPTKLLSVTEDLRQSGKLNPIFRPADWERLHNYQVYSKTVAETSDAGTSIMVAETASKLVQAPATALWGDMKSVVKHTVRPIASFFLMGEILSTPVAYSALGKANFSYARRGADALAVMNEELNRRTREERE